MRDNRICSCDTQQPALRVVLLLVILVTSAAETLAQGTTPVPDTAAQAKAQKLVRDIYRNEYDAAKTPAGRLALARKLLDEAAKAKSDPAEQFVLLRIARDVAVQTGDAETALDAADRIVQTFEVDPVQTKVDCLAAVAEAASSPSQHAALAHQAFSLVDVAAAEDDFEAAEKLAEIALASARRARNYTLLKEIVARMKVVTESEKKYAEYQKAIGRLKDNPTEPDANLAAGRYLCLVKGRWDEGVPMLALGRDEALKAVAQRDMQGASSAEEQVELGDDWWNLAQTRKNEQNEMMLRAGSWYGTAKAGLSSGLTLVKVNKRLEEIAKIGSPIPDTPDGPPSAIAPFGKELARGYQSQWSKHLRVPVVETNSIGMKLVLIPPGEFEMGSTQEEIDYLLKAAKELGLTQTFIDLYLSEGPQHRVKITQPFYLGMFEITQANYQQVMGTNPSRFKTGDPDLPVEQVSWNDAQEFCRRLSELPEEKASGRVYQLPTEAQWEYACRAGTTTRCYYGDDLARLGEYAWMPANSRGRTQRIGQKPPNAWGLCDTLGNVMEWCADWYGDDYYKHSPQDDPSGPSTGTYRALRGGSWLRLPDFFWCAYRNRRVPDYVRDCVGFRVTTTLRP